MPNIKCKACGRRYSYHNSDLCPHCGAYNRPPHRMRVDFDKDGKAEILNEREFLRQSEAGRQREKVCYERKECHEAAARGFGSRKNSVPRAKRIKAVVFAVIAASVIWLLLLTAQRIKILNREYEQPVYEPAIENTVTSYCDIGDPFAMGGQRVMVENAEIVDGELLVMVRSDNELSYMPEVLAELPDGGEYWILPLREENTGDLSLYCYGDDDIDWSNTNSVWLWVYQITDEEYCEVYVDITEAILAE